MTTIERNDLVDAVVASRDEIDPGLEAELLHAIVDAEAAAAGDGMAAIRGIDAAVSAAIGRGVGHLEPTDVATPDDFAEEPEEGEV